MNKPDWKDAPEWANYLAMDADGAWCWFESEPFMKESGGIWDAKGHMLEASITYDNWQETLERRP